MTLRHMLIFRTLCENSCNTTRTAEKLNMAQPAVSLAVKELEDYYGVCLFDRIGRRLQLTESGRQFQQYAIHISDLFRSMETELRDWDTCGKLRIGASITIGSQYMPFYVKAFSMCWPKIDVRVSIHQSDWVERGILSNELDIGLIEGIPSDRRIVSKAYMDDSLSIICPADGRRQQGQVLPLDEFMNERFLLREHGSGTREVFENVIAQAGFSVSPAWESVSTNALINAVINGLGIAVLPSKMVRSSVEQGKVICIRAEGLDFRRQFRIIHHKDKLLTAAARDFIKLCRDYSENYPSPTE